VTYRKIRSVKLTASRQSQISMQALMAELRVEPERSEHSLARQWLPLCPIPRPRGQHDATQAFPPGRVVSWLELMLASCAVASFYCSQATLKATNLPMAYLYHQEAASSADLAKL
jgi:hypothetical protein